MDHAINDARQWTCDVLRGVTSQATQDRRKLAGDITELRLMSTHLPFDTSHLRWTSSAIRALQDRLSAIVPLLSGIEDRLTTLQRIGEEEVSPRWQQLLNDIAAWSEGTEKTTPESGMQLRNAVDEITPFIYHNASWGELIKVNLAARLRTLIDVGEECRNLRHHIENGFHGFPPGSAFRYGGTSPNILHKDYRLALMSSFAAAVAIIACCAFWIATAWPAGSAAAMMCAVFCCLFATQDDPVAGLKPYMQYTLLSIPFSALYLLGVLPAVHGFEMVVLTTAPVFLITGMYIGRPETTGRAMAFLFGVTGTLSMQDTGNADLVSFINSMLGQLAGLCAAVLFTRLFRTVSAEWTARRLMRAGWAELADMSTAARPPTVAMVSARMLDRVGLLTPRLALAGPQEDWNAVYVLSDLRIGLNMTQLLRARPQLAMYGVALQPVLSRLSDHFRRRLATASTQFTQPTQPALLETLDDTLRAVCIAPTTSAQNEAVAALVGIRRDLFPDAPHYQAVASTTEEMTS